jgi:hypothetical protein
MGSILDLRDDTVLERTATGRSELLSHKMSLGAVERRLLALVNGYTPWQDLTAHINDVAMPHQLPERLVQMGLVQVVGQIRPPGWIKSALTPWAESNHGHHSR